MGDATMDKTIRRVTDPEEQQAETYLYWQSLSVGERLSAVWDASEAAYAFALSKERRFMMTKDMKDRSSVGLDRLSA